MFQFLAFSYYFHIESYDVCEKLDALFEVAGEANFLEITKLYGGNNVYIPTYKSAIRNREIIKRYNGVKAVQLASEYGMRVKLYL